MKNSQRTYLLSSFTALAALMNPPIWAQAQDAAPQSEVVVNGKTVRAATRTAIGHGSEALPAAVTVIGRDEVETINIGRDISNIFRRVPGVVANSIDQGDTGNGFRMRGFATQGTHGSDTAVYVDGMPQNMPSSEAGAGHGPAYLEWLAGPMIDRIEVIKGPVSALFGDQNRAGAVAISTADNGEQSYAGIELQGYRGRRASLFFSGPIGDVQSVLVADIYRTGSYRKGAWTDRDNLMWKLSSRVGDSLLSLRINHYRSEFEAAGYLRYDRVAAGLVDRSAAEENALPAFGGGRRTAVVLNRAPADDEQGLLLTAYAEDFERTRGASAGGAHHNVGMDLRQIHGGRIAYNLRAGPAASVMAGLEYRKDSGDAVRQRYANRIATSNYLTNLDLGLLTYGAFVQAQYLPAASVKLTAGLRTDWFDYDIANRKLLAASGSYRSHVTTPKAGIAWTVAPAVDIFANVAEGFRSPSAQQISPAGTMGPLGQRGGIFNGGVSASKVRSLDLGVSASPTDDWSLAGTVYSIANEDEIVTVAPDTFRSVGETTRQGLEVETRVRSAHGLSLYASYAYLLKARIDNAAPNSANEISVPKRQLKAGVAYRYALALGDLVLNADVYTTSGTPYFSGAPLARKLMPTYVRYDLRASFETGRYQFAAYAVLQPHLISEAAYATNAGLFVSPQPRRLFGISARRYF